MNEVAEPVAGQRVWPILWRGKFLILGAIVVMVVLALAYTLHVAKVYQATGVIEVNLPTSTPGSSDTTAANQGLAQNYAQLLTSSGFLNSIRKQVAGGRLSTSEIQSRLKANAVSNTALVQVQATGPSPARAQRLDSQVVNGFLASLQNAASARTAQEQSKLQNEINGLDAQIAALQAAPSSGSSAAQISSLQASRTALISQNATLVANGVAQGTSAAISAAPVASSSPISPRPSLNLLAGLLLGILLGVGLAWIRETLWSSVQTADDASSLLDAPVLASIPLTTRLEDTHAIEEAFAILRANLLFAMDHQSSNVVAVIGYNARVGKTSVIEGLAKASNRSDRNVLLVDGDMRAGTLSTRLGHPNRPGLVDVLQEVISLDQALISLRPGLSLLPTRPTRVNAPSLLSGSRMRTLSAEWRERFDLVLIDTPPIAGLADGLVFASLADLVVMIARSGMTRPADLRAAQRSLVQVQTPLAGVVMFEKTLRERYYYASATSNDAAARAPTAVR